MSSINNRPPSAPPLPRTASEAALDAARLKQSGVNAPLVREREDIAHEGAVTVDPESARKRKLSAQDAERLASQAGYQGAKARRRPGQLDLGDSAHAPIPLPDDDFDAGEWQKETLEQAQEHLGGHSASLSRAAGALAADASAEEVWSAMVGQGHPPSDADVARLSQRAEAPSEAETEAVATAAAGAQARAEALYGIVLGPLSPGATLAATSLLVAGQQEALGSGKTPSDKAILSGVRGVVADSHKAVEDARNMSAGIGKNLAIHRTFVHRR